MKSFASFFYIHRYHIYVTLVILSIFLFSIDIVFASNTLDHTIQEQNGGSSWIGNSLANLVLTISMAIGGIFLTLGGTLLSGAITQTILNAGWWLGDGSSVGTGIREMWTVIRDIFNIVFIFAFIFIGIKTILNADDSGVKRSLGLLIVAALLINFSLYFAQVIIDFSNIAAVQVHNQILKTEGIGSAETPINDPEYLAPQHGGIVGAFMDTVNISSWWGGTEDLNMSGTQIFIYAIMMLFFLIITGIVCGMGAILLIRRFISLIIYLILSPIMFAGWIFPAFMGYQAKWRKGFLEQAFFAPAFLFMLYLSLFVLGRVKAELGIESDTQYGAVFDGSSFTIFLFFCMGIGFLYASIKVGEMMSVAGASGMVKSLNSMKGMAQSLAYRNTVGRSMRLGVKGLDALDRAADNKKGLVGLSARTARFLGADESLRRGAESIQNKGINGGRGLETVEKDEKTAKARGARTNQITAISDAIKAGGTDMERAVKDASSAQIVEMFKDDNDKIISVAGNLTDSQVEAINKDDAIDDNEKNKLNEARGIAVGKRLVSNKGDDDGNVDDLKDDGSVDIDPATGKNKKRKATLDDGIGKASTSELQSLGFKTILKHAGKLSSKQIDDLKLVPTEKKQLDDQRKIDHKKEFDKNPKGFFTRISNDTERSKLDISILNSKEAIPYLNTKVLAKIVSDNDGISNEQRKGIKQSVLSYHEGQADYTTYINVLTSYKSDKHTYDLQTLGYRRTHPAPVEPTKNASVKESEEYIKWFDDGVGRLF